MSKRIMKFRRDRWRDQVLVVGKRLRELQAVRAGINSTLWPHDVAAIDDSINRLTRKRDRLLDRLKETA